MLSVSSKTRKISLFIRKYLNGKSRSVNERANREHDRNKTVCEIAKLGSENLRCKKYIYIYIYIL